MLKWLNRPYPYEGTWHESLRSAFYGGLFVFLFLVIFRPFGLGGEKVNFWRLALVCGYFGMVTTAVLALLSLTMRIIPSFFKEEGWVVWKEIITNVVVVVMIGVGNMLLATLLFGQKLTLSVFWEWQKITISIGFFPIFFTTYTKQSILQKKHTKGADKINEKIAGHHEGYQKNEPTIHLIGDNQNERISLHPSDLFYAEAADNYVRIFYRKNNLIENEMLRSTLKNMAQQLNDYGQFFRCHRTYLVNLNKVNHVSGNAQGYKLHLENIDTLIPVSRSLNGEIVERFK